MKINKIKFILVFFLLLVGSMETIAQVQQYPKMAASNSIARTINEGTAIIYSQKSATQGCFILTSDAVALYFDLLPGMLVNDFEVDDLGNAWFCGELSGSPMVGTFPIATTFAGTTNVQCGTYDSASNHPVFLRSINRMDVAKMGGIRFPIAVGEGIPNTTNPTSDIIGVVLSADPTLSQGYMGYDKTLTVRYTDIAALDNIIVAVGTSQSGNGSFAKTFVSNIQFPQLPFFRDYVYKLSCVSLRTQAMLVAKQKGDIATSAQYVKNGYGVSNAILDFSPAGMLNSVQAMETTNPLPLPAGYSPSKLEIRDIRYSSRLDKTLVLHRGYHSQSVLSPTAFSVDSWLVPFPTTLTTTGNVWRLTQGDEHSLHTVGGQPFTSGTDYGGGFLHTYNCVAFADSPCQNATPTIFNAPTCTVTQIAIADRDFDFDWTPLSFSPTVHPQSVTTICGE